MNWSYREYSSYLSLSEVVSTESCLLCIAAEFRKSSMYLSSVGWGKHECFSILIPAAFAVSWIGQRLSHPPWLTTMGVNAAPPRFVEGQRISLTHLGLISGHGRHGVLVAREVDVSLAAGPAITTILHADLCRLQRWEELGGGEQDTQRTNVDKVAEWGEWHRETTMGRIGRHAPPINPHWIKPGSDEEQSCPAHLWFLDSPTTICDSVLTLTTSWPVARKGRPLIWTQCWREAGSCALPPVKKNTEICIFADIPICEYHSNLQQWTTVGFCFY